MFLKKIKEDSGQMLVMTLLAMSVLLGFLAIAIDVGVLFDAKRRVQTAADGAAIAGALEWEYNGSTNVTSVARTAAGNNGIANTATTVNVNVSPNITSPYHNASGYVEVVVHQPNPSAFMNLFKAWSSHGADSMPTVNVTARAIAGITPAPNCDIQLDNNNDDNALWVKGNTTIKTPHCGIQVNSTSSGAFCDQGNAQIDGPYVHVTGNQAGGGKCGKSPGAPVLSGIPPAADPYAGLPDASAACNAGDTVGGTSVTGSTSLAVSAVQTVATGLPFANTTYTVTCFSGNPVTITGTFGSANDPGHVYVFQHGVTISGTATVYGTIDIAQGSFAQGNATLNVYATGSDSAGQNSGSYKSYTFNSIGVYQPATNNTGTCQDSSIKSKMNGLTGSPTCLQVQFGSGSSSPPNGNINAMIYAPNSVVYLQDQGGGVQAAGIVSYAMFVNSQLSLTNSYNTENAASTPLTTVSLVE